MKFEINAGSRVHCVPVAQQCRQYQGHRLDSKGGHQLIKISSRSLNAQK